MRLRRGETSDWPFLVEMSRLACGLDDRPLPEADDPAVQALMPATPHAAERFDALTLNVHLRSPAVALYVRTGFRVAGHGRGWYGVAMRRSLR